MVVFLFAWQQSVYAGTTPPETSHEYNGTEGLNGWYISNVEVTLTAQDFESGPKSTTYWLNSDPPTTTNYSSSENQVKNPSFESGFLLWAWDWEKGPHVPFWEAEIFRDCLVFRKFGWCSGAIIAHSDGWYYWYNRGKHINVTAGNTYTASAWIHTLDIWGTGAWFEIWKKGNHSSDDELLLQSPVVYGSSGWTLLQDNITIPSGTSRVYFRLGVESNLGWGSFDGISFSGAIDNQVVFTVVENGAHTLHYYSVDNNDNVETTHNVNLWIDSVAPDPWDEFVYVPGSNPHSYITKLNAEDVTSGMDVSTAEYKYYTDDPNIGPGWSDWAAIDTVTVESTGLDAADGETDVVVLTTPEIDFGSESTVLQVQIRINDMAGNISNSPVQTIAGAWTQISGGADVHVETSISMTAPAIAGEYNSDGVLTSGDTITNFDASTDYVIENYTHALGDAVTLDDYLSEYDKIRNEAVLLPGNKLPVGTGIYYYSGNYVLDANSILPGFELNDISAIIIIEGDLRIKDDVDPLDTSALLFLVEGNVEVEGDVSEIAGVYILEGTFHSNIDNAGFQKLTINGSVIAADGFVLGRDLGRVVSPGNEDEPAEEFIYQVHYLVKPEFVQLVGGSNAQYSWHEMN